MLTKTEALAKHLSDQNIFMTGDSVDDITENDYNDSSFDYGNAEFMVYTDAEADEAVKENIRDSVWAFNPGFLASETGLDEEMFAFAAKKCEDANDAILRCIEKTCGLDSFVSDAVSSDGRGHFLSGYDGEENEVNNYFIYRNN